VKITASILQRGFIGLKAKIVRSSNPSNVGISGKIIDDTQNTLAILHNNKKKVIAKETSVFHLTLPDNQVIEVDGKILIGRLEDRVKKALRRRW
jgi:ribonuclease P protein subunit POP4